MKKQQKNGNNLFLILCLIFVISFPTYAQTSPPSSQSAKDTRLEFLEEFQNCLNKCSERWKVTFVVEGEPYKPLISKVLDVSSPNVNLKMALKYLCDKFDYESKTQNNLNILLKKYSDINELPEVAFDEAIQCLKKSETVMGEFDSRFVTRNNDLPPFLNLVLETLTPIQLTQLSDSGVQVTELSENSQSFYRRLGLYLSFHTQIESIRKCLQQFKALKKNDAVFQWKKIKEYSLFGYETRNDELQKKVFVTVGGASLLSKSYDGLGYEFHPDPITGKMPEIIDRTDPSLLDSSLPYSPYNSTTSKPFSFLIHELNTRPLTKTKYLTDSIYSEKRLSWAGLKYSSSLKILEAARQIFGYQFVRDSENTFKLSFPDIVVPKTYKELGKSLHMILPSQIHRLFESHIVKNDALLTGEPHNAIFYEYNSIAAKMLPNILQRFRLLCEKEVSSAKTKSVELSKLSAKARKLFMLSLFIGTYSRIDWLSDCSIPPCITDFDHILLTGSVGEEDNQRYISVYLSYIDPNSGHFQKGIGFERLYYPPAK